MKVLFFVDTHGSSLHMRRIVEKARLADLLVCAGDFTIFENDMNRILRDLNSLGKPLLVIHGNHEEAHSIMHSAIGLDNIHLIHNKFHIIGDYVFFGHGGGGFLTRNDKFDRIAHEFMKDLRDLEKKNNKSYKIVFITHQPPYATMLDFIGVYTGCENYTKFIVEHKPVLAVSGHIHETAGQEDRINDTKLINPGPIGVIIDLK